MVSHAASVSVVGNSAAPLLHVFGREIGEWIQKVGDSVTQVSSSSSSSSSSSLSSSSSSTLWSL